MPLENYGVLKGRALNRRRGVGRSRHYHLHVQGDGVDYRAAINFRSKVYPSQILFAVDDDFDHPITAPLLALPEGFQPLAPDSRSGALDYVRGNLFHPGRLRSQPADTPNPQNDLRNRIDAYVERAILHPEATVYVFGEPWGPEKRADKHFRFEPSQGLHEIHMNQGNSTRYADNDGVWQDGGLLIHFPVPAVPDGAEWHRERWIAVFLAFQSQCLHTDDLTGVRLDPDPGRALHAEESDFGAMRIVAALVNPYGDDEQGETVTVLNSTPGTIDPAGWAVADTGKRRTPLSGPPIPAGAVRVVEMADGEARLGNQGGTISLLDPRQRKIDGVAYTAGQASRQGWTLVF